MALFVRQDEQRSQLQQKVASDLKRKLASSDIKAADTEPAILEDEHQTRPAGMIIIALIVVGIIVGVFIVFNNK